MKDINLIIDVGNSFVKLAGFKYNALVFKTVIHLEALTEKVKTLKVDYPAINKGIISSVGRLDNNQIKTLEKDIDLLQLTHNTKVPFTNSYKTPKTLGIDRIALVSAATYHYPNQNTLVIDAGTCITYDIVTQSMVYLGGAISPGITMRYKALNNFTAKLPLLEKEHPSEIIGNTTESSIHVGVVRAVVNEINGFISAYKDIYPDLTVILTGGDANFLSEQLKSGIFANSNFLLEGLNYILEFNTN
ncbi:type III pantothenate kinase [Flavobacteriaceae bacterium MHTCC 0001]